MKVSTWTKTWRVVEGKDELVEKITIDNERLGPSLIECQSSLSDFTLSPRQPLNVLDSITQGFFSICRDQMRIEEPIELFWGTQRRARTAHAV